MNSIGFNASIKDYEFELVTSMIDNHKPVIIYGIPGWQLTSCHCWNIDGYKIKTRTKTINTYKNNELVKTEQKQETYKMVLIMGTRFPAFLTQRIVELKWIMEKDPIALTIIGFFRSCYTN